mgnify:CR=1 FL=1
MAAPARKRVLKKVSAKKGSESEASTKAEKSPKSEKIEKVAKAAKTSKKKAAEAPVVESAPAPVKAKKGVVPVPIFQAPARTKDLAKKSPSGKADIKSAAVENSEQATPSEDESKSETGEGRSRHRNRRRGGRGRGRNRQGDGTFNESGDSGSDGADESSDSSDDKIGRAHV